ncbi:MAG: class II aldolase/adducin family protein [Chloroflexi bacterium]|nr:class II aldolase/adducin family protein [Chloroflexota bacterium]
MSLSHLALRHEIVRIGRLMHEQQFVDGASGNLSARLPDGNLLATPSGLAKGFLEPEQLLVVDPAGAVVEAASGLKPTSELLMHLEVYRRRLDVGGVIHAHPITSVALSIAGVSLAECVIPEAVVILGLVPTTPYATPASDENQRAISNLVLGHDAIILAYHGTLTVGKDLWEAYLKLETLEHTAKIIASARMMGAAPALPPEQVSKLIQARKEGGYARPGDEGEFCLACGVCHPTQQHTLAQEDRLAREIAHSVRRALSQG